MDNKKRLQRVSGLAIVALLLAGCVGAEPVPPATAAPPTNTPIPTDPPPAPTTAVPTDTPKPTPFVPLPTPTLTIDTSVQMEQAIIGIWVNSPEDVHNRRYHVYTEDGIYCAGNYLPPLLEGDPKSCKAYEINGNTLSEICAEGSVGCTVGDVCEVEVHVMENGWLHYFVPEPCPTYMSGHPVVGDPEIFFMRVEEP